MPGLRTGDALRNHLQTLRRHQPDDAGERSRAHGASPVIPYPFRAAAGLLVAIALIACTLTGLITPFSSVKNDDGYAPGFAIRAAAFVIGFLSLSGLIWFVSGGADWFFVR